NEIACLLAATSNDAYNALVCSHFVSTLGHDRVFQLPMYAPDEDNSAQVVARPLRGRQAFAENAQYEELWRRHYQRWQFHKTRLTENYTREDFLNDLPADAMIIASLNAQGALLFRSVKKATRLAAGDTVIYYAPRKNGKSGGR